jgi:hypothetical protein
MIFAILGLAFTAIPTKAQAQVFDTEALGQEVLWSDFFGVDARAIGMGNTGLALGHDGSALIYNPANWPAQSVSYAPDFRAWPVIRGGLRRGDVFNGRRYLEDRINALSLAITVYISRFSGLCVWVHRINSHDRAFGCIW